jgi:hydrogenase maturation protease
MGVVDILGRVSRVVIVDAVLAHPIGAVLELSPDELSEAAPQPASSHGMGAAQALRLASALAPEATERVRVVAIAIARPAAYRDGLSPQVAAAVPIAADRVLSIVGG